MPDGPGDRRADGPRAAAAVVLAVAAALLAAAIAGCGGGGGGGEGSTDTGAAVSSTPSQAPPTEKTTGTGEDNNGSGGGRAASHHSIPDVVSAVLTSGDPAKACGAGYVTTHYLDTAYGGKAGCLNAQASKSAARSLKFNDVVTSSRPGQATAKAVPEGGLYDGEKLTISLVQENGTWKVDGLKSNAPVGP